MDKIAVLIALCSSSDAEHYDCNHQNGLEPDHYSLPTIPHPEHLMFRIQLHTRSLRCHSSDSLQGANEAEPDVRSLRGRTPHLQIQQDVPGKNACVNCKQNFREKMRSAGRSLLMTFYVMYS
ncbi:hypothetical protein Mapa_003398 [Marchantia paleacea]|nr:hypothetical protein Mapa_003398 [Marchantia paleacea]